MVTKAEALERLAAAEWLKNPDLQLIFRVLDGAAGRTRAVGGLVRDTLLGISRDGGDVDLATELLPEEVMARAGMRGFATYPTGTAHGTVTLKLGALVVEVTTLRRDVETDGRHAVVQFGKDWKEDAARRDFTMNALYVDSSGTLFDPIKGLSDCVASRVRFIGDPDKRIAEDRLRVFRFFRFCTSHGRQRFDDAGFSACAKAAAELGSLSAERVGAEMIRILALPKAAVTLGKMVEAGVLTLPCDVEAQIRYEKLARTPSASGRLALMLHGGNGVRFSAAWRLANRTFADAEAVLAAARLLVAGQLHAAGYRYREALANAVPVAGAIAGWKGADIRKLEVAEGRLEVPPFPVNGTDLLALGMDPGKRLGEELGRLEDAWVESGYKLGRAQLLARVRLART